MIEVKDRIPTYPGRIKLIPVEGQANTYDMVRADEPVEPGTPLDKALFDSFANEINALQKRVSDSLFAMTQRTALENVAVGTEIGLYENGVLVPFIVLSKAYDNSGRVLVVRKNCYKMDTLFDAGENFYTDCKTDKWLSNEYIACLDEATQGVLATVSLDIAVANKLTTIPRKVFLLSAWEYNARYTQVGQYEGEVLTYFDTNDKRVAKYLGSPVIHYTRTISYTSGDDDCDAISATGTVVAETDPVTVLHGIRPAFTLPLGFEVTVGVPDELATAEVIE